MNRIVAFDVETPNCRNDRICAIGITLIENNQVVDSMYYLVNPECEFDYRNIQIHGIRPEDVANAPSFPEVWESIGELFRTSLVAAHNATFDLCVLRKTLGAYGLSEALVYYVCTVKIARAKLTGLESHGLASLCDYYQINLDHHNAGSDSDACAQILCRFLAKGLDLDTFTKSYELTCPEEKTSEKKPKKLSGGSQALLVLKGILTGVTCDNNLTDDEVHYLQSWLEDNLELKGNFPYDKIYSVITKALEDGILQKSELDSMLQLFINISDPVASESCDCQNTEIANKTICLSGEFKLGGKAFVEEKLVALGAVIHKTVSAKTEIVIAGDNGSTAWCAENYGTKIKKALELQDKGIEIKVVRETDFFALLEGK